MKITLPATALRAAFLIAPKNDVRYYLNGAFISKKGEVVATDGSRLIVVETHVDMPEDFPEKGIIVSRPPVVIPANLSKDELTIEFVPGEWTATMDWCLGSMPINIVDGNFPQWERIIPRTAMPTSQDIGFNGKFLADLPKISKALCLHTTNVKMVLPGDASTASIFELLTTDLSSAARYIVMPVRIKR